MTEFPREQFAPGKRRLFMLMFPLAVGLIGIASVSAQDDSRFRSRETPRALPLPARVNGPSETSGKSKSISASNSLISTAVSLSLIVGALFVAGRWMKRNGFRGPQQLPDEALEVLGRRTLEPRASVHLVRLGSRVLLLGVGGDGVRTLSEIDDPVEVERLIRACDQESKSETLASVATKTVSRAMSSRSIPSAPRVLTILLGLGLIFLSTQVSHAQPARPGSVTTRLREQPKAIPESRVPKIQPASLEMQTGESSDSTSGISPQQLGASLKLVALMSVFSLAPSILMMTTCFVRFIVVLGLLRQALGTQHGLPSHVLSAICLFLTFLVMSPIWQRSYQEGIRPYTNPAPGEVVIDETTAIHRALKPVRGFMSEQIDMAGNADAVWMLLDYQQSPDPVDSESRSNRDSSPPESYDDVPFTVLAPAYLLSELKVGFLIGFQLFLPFLVIDLVVATILTSLGLTMMPPSTISMPFKLLLFVLIDGWFLTVGMLLESVRVA
ncbi:flagellar biosynthetic protein FliO [Schlesneria paludicola]|uniref:flagellar biosynthetic protein FliO n=1 Tax=Schlesneria paludicola TaxID=360056 RepID=UPI0002D97327|nr:flagellar biosynthetic protein FliO [Schlesneria paludicola]